MKSLFAKIFLWFWLASLLIIVSTVTLVSLLEPYRPVPEDGRIVKRMARQGQRAVEILERHGEQALQEFIHNKARRQGRRVFLFNEKIETIGAAVPPPEAGQLAARSGKSGVTEFLKLKGSVLIARPIYGSGGETYLFVGDIPRRPHNQPLSRFLNPHFLSLRFLAIFVVASFFCYWLAWYLTSPIRKLRTAAQQLASGDLKTRVSKNLGGRKDELADLGHDFDLMADRIEALLESQGRLYRDISHELRSPLARLHVALELARQRSGKEAAEDLDRIEREAERLNELIGHMRTLTVLESGGENIQYAPVELDLLVREIAEDADFEARNQNRKVNVMKSEGVKVNGNEEMLRRAVENVVRNAVRYTPEDSEVEISLISRQDNSENYAHITVRDHGSGVPEEVLGDLFRPFYRVGDARDRKTGGTGIGLAITEKAVRLHGGTVTASNAADGGLIVEIKLPASL